jgi:two-component system sensor histidine kinase and response regulator WspE
VDLISALARAPEGQSPPEQAAWQSDADSFVRALAQPTVAPVPVPAPVPAQQPSAVEEAIDRSLRVSAENLNRMLDLAGETLVESHRLRPFEQALLRIKRMQRAAAVSLETLEAALPDTIDERARAALADARNQLFHCRQQLSHQLDLLETQNHRGSNLAHRLYNQALMVRMRPFVDGLGRFRAWCATSGANWASRCVSRSPESAPRSTATFWNGWTRLWFICCAMHWITGWRCPRTALPWASRPRA